MQELREKVEMLRGLGHLIEAPQRIGLKYKISLNLRSGAQIQSISNSKELVVIGCLTLNLEREKVLIRQRRSQLIESVVKSTMMSALRGTNNCISCGKSGQKMRDSPNFKSLYKGSGHSQASGSRDALKKNRFYTLRSRGEQKTSPDVVIGMLKIFSIDVYALLDPSATLSFVTPLVAKKFDVLPDILHDPFLVSTSVGQSVVAKRVYQNFPISLSNRVSYLDILELDMLDFNIIFGMDWLHACFASIDCRLRVVKFNFPNELVVEWKG